MNNSLRSKRGAAAQQLHVPVERERRRVQLPQDCDSRQRHGSVRHHLPAQPGRRLLRLPQVRGLPERDVLRLGRRDSEPRAR